MRVIYIRMLGAVLLFAVSCAPRRSIPPRPIDVAREAAVLIERTLDDPVALDAMEWDLEMLARAALRLHPDMEVAGARVRTSEAAVVAAGQRPNPRFGFNASLNTPLGIVLPWILQPSFDLQLGGGVERRFRVAEAERWTDAARLDAGQAAWQVRSRVRARLIGRLMAERNVQLIRDEEALRSEFVRLLETKLSFGDVARIVVDQERMTLRQARLGIAAAETRAAEALAALAASVGVPVRALSGKRFVYAALDNPPAPDAPFLARLERDALLNRLEVRRALAAYAALEAALQGEVAAQQPPAGLGPAFRWTEEQRRWTLGFSREIPLFNRNDGPLAIAEARRAEAAAAFAGLQAGILAEVELASARYHAAIAEYDLARELEAAAVERARVAEALYDVRDVDYTAVVGARLEVALAGAAVAGALERVQLTLGELEDAAQKPLDGSAGAEGRVQ